MAKFTVYKSVNVMLLFVTLGSSLVQAQEAQDTEALSTVRLESVARITSFNQTSKRPGDIYDKEIYSPKSAAFSRDGKKLYINSLEGTSTQVYSWPDLKKRKSIYHRFTEAHSALFQGETTVFDYPYFQNRPNVNVFQGKPVEMTFSHGGRYLWITYYRRSYDPSAQSPSAVAIVDTKTDSIVRVMPTGPIPKYVAASPDGRFVAITHWGDNTLGLIDVQNENPAAWTYVRHLVVERKLEQGQFAGKNRDANCGFCLRGTVFSKDSRALFVGRMTGGGVAGFDVDTGTYLGTLDGMPATPRHLVIDDSGESLIMTNNSSGMISKISVEEVQRTLHSAGGRHVQLRGWKTVQVGIGARTIDLADGGRLAFVAVNKDTKVVAVDLTQMKVVDSLKVDPYPVGLAVSPDGGHVAITSQGRQGHGGNMITIVRTK